MSVSRILGNPRAADFPQRIERLLRRLAPDDPPIRVVFRSALACDFSGTEGVEGCMLLPGLISDAPAILINDALLAREAERLAEIARPVGLPVNVEERLASALVAVTLHEAAHCFEREWIARDKANNWSQVAVDLRAFTTRPTCGPTAAVPWNLHEWRFLRAAGHVVFRASRLGIEIDLGSVACTRALGLSWPPRYYEAIRPELRRLRNKSFAEIRATAPPRALIRLFLDDTERWFRAGHKSPSLLS